jgi:2-methylcitrate dehydratase
VERIGGTERQPRGPVCGLKQLDTPFKLGELGGHGLPFKIEGIFHKYLPVVYSIQLPVLTAFELRRKIKIEEIDSVVVYADSHLAYNDIFSSARWDPRNRETADHSGPYLLGAALVDGEITEETMTPRRYRDPAILALIKKIRVEEDKSYTAARSHTHNCRLEATLKSGKVVTVHQTNPKGHPANPMTDQELEAKFLNQVGDQLAQAQTRKLLDSLWDFENLSSMDNLFALMVIQDRRQ